MPETLQSIAQQLLANHKGLLAADESVPSAGKRLAAVGVENTPETRRQYRNLFLTTPGVEQYLSGVIFHDETFGQAADDGTPFVQLLQQRGIVPGIKVDGGTQAMPESPKELLTQGLDGLDARLADYHARGARFAKWRAALAIGDGLPTTLCLEENAKVMAEYAALCQQHGIVPIVEPEVLIDGDHDLATSEAVTAQTLRVTFDFLTRRGVDLTGLILKSSMVISGSTCVQQASPAEIADATIRCFTQSVPTSVPGIVFLSGGQSTDQATANLNAIALVNPGPWTISFSFARALQSEALQVWQGQAKNLAAAQAVFLRELHDDVAANRGEYTAA